MLEMVLDETFYKTYQRRSLVHYHTTKNIMGNTELYELSVRNISNLINLVIFLISWN